MHLFRTHKVAVHGRDGSCLPAQTHPTRRTVRCHYPSWEPRKPVGGGAATEATPITLIRSFSSQSPLIRACCSPPPAPGPSLAVPHRGLGVAAAGAAPATRPLLPRARPPSLALALPLGALAALRAAPLTARCRGAGTAVASAARSAAGLGSQLTQSQPRRAAGSDGGASSPPAAAARRAGPAHPCSAGGGSANHPLRHPPPPSLFSSSLPPCLLLSLPAPPERYPCEFASPSVPAAASPPPPTLGSLRRRAGTRSCGQTGGSSGNAERARAEHRPAQPKQRAAAPRSGASPGPRWLGRATRPRGSFRPPRAPSPPLAGAAAKERARKVEENPKLLS